MTIARQSAIAIENARLLARRKAELDAVGKFQQTIIGLVPQVERHDS